MEECLWSKLPMELQKSIAECVPAGGDYLRFRAVCRTWRSLAPPFRWTSDLTCSTTIQYPWLMFSQGEKSICNFYDPRDNLTYPMYNAELSDCVIRFSKDGWLLISRGPRSMFFYEPFTKMRIELPNLPFDYCFNGICASASPTSSNFIIFCITHFDPGWLRIYYLDSSGQTWTWVEVVFYNNRPFLPSWNNPVFLKGLFYCLGEDGSLGIFELTERECTWKILNHPQPLCFPSAMCWNFLVSVDEELLSVFVGSLGKWVKVFKLLHLSDWSKWVGVKSLGDQMLFVSQTTSLAVMAQEERMKNKIYFPMFSNINGNNVFYSLETSRYQTFASDYSSGVLYEIKEQVHSTWIQPRLVPTFR